MKKVRKILSLLLAVILTASLLPGATLSAAAETAYRVLCEPNIEGTVINAADNMAVVYTGVYRLLQYKDGKVEVLGEQENGWVISDLIELRRDGKWGIIDRTGKEIVPFKYDYMSWPWDWDTDARSTVIRVCLDGKWGLIDETGAEIIPCKYDDMEWWRNEDLMEVKLNGKWGCIDKTGTEVVSCKYDSVYPFYEGLAAVVSGGKVGYVDQTGAEVVPCKYDNWVNHFCEGMATVCLDGKWGCIDKTGAEVVPCKYDWTTEFHEGLARVSLDHKVGYVDATGAEVVPCKYDEAHDCYEGLACVKSGGKWGCIDKTGVEVIPCTYDSVHNSGYESYDFVVVALDGKYGFYNRTGTEIVPCKYDGYNSYYSDDLMRVKLDEKWGLIDKAGTEVVPCQYGYISRNFSADTILVCTSDNKWGLIDKSGAEVIACIYENIYSEFSGNLIGVCQNGKFGFIDKTGAEVIPCKYDDSYNDIYAVDDGDRDFGDGPLAMGVDGKYGFIDETGAEVIPFKYDGAWDFYNGWAKVCLNEKWGYIDETGAEIIPCKYNNLEHNREKDLLWASTGSSVAVYGKADVERVAVTGVTLAKRTASVRMGRSVSLAATVRPANASNKNVYWTSSDTDIVTVDNSGKLTGVAAGTADVTVTTVDGGFTATCAVTVAQAASGGGGGGSVSGGGSSRPAATPTPAPASTAAPTEYVYDAKDPGEAVTLPVAKLDSVTDANTAVSAVQSQVKSMTTEQKNSATGTDLATLYAETAVSRAASKKVSGKELIISKAAVADLEAVAAKTSAAVESELVKGGVSTARLVSNTVSLVTDQTGEITIKIDPDILETTADKIRVETPSYAITLKVADLKADLADGIITITTQEVGSGYAPGNKTGKTTVKVNLPKGKTSNPVTLSLPKDKGDTSYQAVVKTDGSATSSKYNPATTTMDGKVNTSGSYTVQTSQKDFTDIANKSAEMQKAIRYLASKGIIEGTSATTFSPDATISRSEIAALLVRALGKLDSGATNTFTDVKSGDWYYAAAGSSQKVGLINGYPDNTFRGTTTIAKDQILAVAARVLKNEMGYKTPGNAASYLTKYSDGVAAWAQPEVALATKENLVVYRTDGTFKGTGSMTRGNAAIVIYRLFQKIW